MAAGVSILTLLDSARADTIYQIHILHSDLGEELQQAFYCLTNGTPHNIYFHYISPERFTNIPENFGSWTKIVYYRLLICEILHFCDKAIYSDVDVFFKEDLSSVFNSDLNRFSWAGIAGEKNTADMICHKFFPENPNEFIYFSGFMVMNLAQMREQKAVDRYVQIIDEFFDRLKFFDLDILNLSSRHILRIPLKYCLLEDIYESDNITLAKDYNFLKSVYSMDEIEQARDNPAIIHFAGHRGKPWQRQSMPEYYREVVKRLPTLLQRTTLRDFKKRWFSRKAYYKYPTRCP